jgi:hypothetical protein
METDMAKPQKRSRRAPTRENSRDTYAVIRRGQAAGADLERRMQNIADDFSRQIGVRVLKTMIVPDISKGAR